MTTGSIFMDFCSNLLCFVLGTIRLALASAITSLVGRISKRVGPVVDALRIRSVLKLNWVNVQCAGEKILLAAASWFLLPVALLLARLIWSEANFAWRPNT